MGKFVLIITIIYLLYYGGNIIYDLFLKKEKVIEDDNNLQEFSMSDFADEVKEDVRQIGIDDVENMVTPQKEEYVEAEQGVAEEPNIEQMREQFEAEQELEKQESEPKLSDAERKKQLEEQREKARKERQKKHREMLRMAETSVQVLESIDGQKVYQTVMDFS